MSAGLKQRLARELTERGMDPPVSGEYLEVFDHLVSHLKRAQTRFDRSGCEQFLLETVSELAPGKLEIYCNALGIITELVEQDDAISQALNHAEVEVDLEEEVPILVEEMIRGVVEGDETPSGYIRAHRAKRAAPGTSTDFLTENQAQWVDHRSQEVTEVRPGRRSDKGGEDETLPPRFLGRRKTIVTSVGWDPQRGLVKVFWRGHLERTRLQEVLLKGRRVGREVEELVNWEVDLRRATITGGREALKGFLVALSKSGEIKHLTLIPSVENEDWVRACCREALSGLEIQWAVRSP